jgi:hypothetical protein
MIRAAALLINHIGFGDRGRKLEMAMDICQQYEKKLVITGRSDGATGREFSKYLMETMELPNLEEKWKSCQP